MAPESVTYWPVISAFEKGVVVLVFCEMEKADEYRFAESREITSGGDIGTTAVDPDAAAWSPSEYVVIPYVPLVGSNRAGLPSASRTCPLTRNCTSAW